MSGNLLFSPLLLDKQLLIQNVFRAIMVAGSGFFTDAYDIFSINMGMIPVR